MISSVSSIKPLIPHFSAKSEQKRENTQTKAVEDNPISRKGETMNLIKATFLGGVVLGAKLLFELVHRIIFQQYHFHLQENTREIEDLFQLYTCTIL